MSSGEIYENHYVLSVAQSVTPQVHFCETVSVQWPVRQRKGFSRFGRDLVRELKLICLYFRYLSCMKPFRSRQQQQQRADIYYIGNAKVIENHVTSELHTSYVSHHGQLNHVHYCQHGEGSSDYGSDTEDDMQQGDVNENYKQNNKASDMNADPDGEADAMEKETEAMQDAGGSGGDSDDDDIQMFYEAEAANDNNDDDNYDDDDDEEEDYESGQEYDGQYLEPGAQPRVNHG